MQGKQCELEVRQQSSRALARAHIKNPGISKTLYRSRASNQIATHPENQSVTQAASQQSKMPPPPIFIYTDLKGLERGKSILLEEYTILLSPIPCLQISAEEEKGDEEKMPC